MTARDVAAIGITNQRETVVVWDRATGRPIHNAIVWQDRRTADTAPSCSAGGSEGEVAACTGLLLDPYFSATKIAWLLDHCDRRARAAQAGRLAFGTVDSFLLWRLTGGKVHATDATNAARTLLLDIRRGDWDAGMCDLFGVPAPLLAGRARLRRRVRHDGAGAVRRRRSASSAWPATSRRRPSGRAASRPA